MRLSSRERMLFTMEHKPVDHVPCCFMIFGALRWRCADEFEFFRRQLELGLDVRVELPNLPLRYQPGVEVSCRRVPSDVPGRFLLEKTYRTATGTLKAVVDLTDDWRAGDDIPIFSDYVAVRSRKFLIETEQDLQAFQTLLAPPSDEDIRQFRKVAAEYKHFADEHGLLVSAGYRGGLGGVAGDGGTMGMDALMWLCGIQNAIFAAIDRPDFVHDVSEVIRQWNLARTRVYLDTGIDLLVRRAWYEGTEFWSPDLYRRFMVPHVSEEINLVHHAGARFGYIMTSGMASLLGPIRDMRPDVVIGIDPVQGKGTDLKLFKRELAGRVAIWGGISGDLNIEHGTPEEIIKVTNCALDTLGPGGEFILSPVDNVRDTSDSTWKNVEVFIDTWKTWVRNH